jgi:hypothetical protein
LSVVAEYSEKVYKVLMKDLDVSKVEFDELICYVRKKDFRT